MVRLRKLSQPEFDVSSERLKWRPHIEDQVDRILKEHVFQRVVNFGDVNGRYETRQLGTGEGENARLQHNYTDWSTDPIW